VKAFAIQTLADLPAERVTYVKLFQQEMEQKRVMRAKNIVRNATISAIGEIE
jgi:hypothetical protein